MKIRKLTDNELKKQIRLDRVVSKMYTIVFIICVVGYLVIGYIELLIFALMFLIFAFGCQNQEMHDKIRLEIRGR